MECNFIKSHQPRYNILLRDDKQYPYLKLTLNEKFPRLLVTRRVKGDGARYFGPYTDVGALNETLQLLRKCSHSGPVAATILLADSGPVSISILTAAGVRVGEQSHWSSTENWCTN